MLASILTNGITYCKKNSNKKFKSFQKIYKLFLNWQSNEIVEIIFVIVCPESCKTCKTGGAGDGSKPVNSEGLCQYFCSTGGYCGDGYDYKSGKDCRLCEPGKSL